MMLRTTLLSAAWLVGCGASSAAGPVHRSADERTDPSGEEASTAVSAAAALAWVRIDEAVFYAPEREMVYLLDPELVALDASTGGERWRVSSARGEILDASEQGLLVSARSALPQPLHWVSAEGASLGSCDFDPPGRPATADRLTTSLAFVDDALEVTWFSNRYRPTAGTYSPSAAPDPATGCGTVILDLGSCASRPTAPSAECTEGVAATIPLLSGSVRHGDLVFALAELAGTVGGPCGRSVIQSLQVTSPSGTWEHRLREVIAGCPAPAARKTDSP